MTHVYEAKANVNDIEGTGLPRQWGCNIQLLEFKVGGDRAGKGPISSALSRKTMGGRHEPRQHWTIVDPGHFGIRKALCALNCPVICLLCTRTTQKRKKQACHIPEPDLRTERTSKNVRE